MAADHNHYGVILQDAEGMSVAEGIRQFPESLEVGKTVAYEGRDWLVESINERISPPIVVLAMLV